MKIMLLEGTVSRCRADSADLILNLNRSDRQIILNHLFNPIVKPNYELLTHRPPPNCR
jgi:hypothetical protein